MALCQIVTVLGTEFSKIHVTVAVLIADAHHKCTSSHVFIVLLDIVVMAALILAPTVYEY